MATRYIKAATSELSPVFDPATADIKGQGADTQALYEQLLASLSQQQQTGTQNIVSSAERRGVSRAGLEGDIGLQLGQETALGGAQLGAQRASDMAAIQGGLTDIASTRASAQADTAGQFQQGAIDTATAKLNKKKDLAEQRMSLQKLERMSGLELQKLERHNELSIMRQRAQASQAAAAQAEAVAAGAVAQPEMFERDAQRDKDGKVINRQYGFVDANGNAISAAKYAELSGVPLGSLLKQMGDSGDQYARVAYNRIKSGSKQLSKSKKMQNLVKQRFSPLFWGT